MPVSEIDEMNDPYYRMIRQGVELEALRLNIVVAQIIRITHVSFDFSSLSKEGGVIIIGSFMPKTIKKIQKANPNVVIVDDSNSLKDVDTVYPNLKLDTFNVLDYLLKEGHTEIAFIGGRKTWIDELGNTEPLYLDNRVDAYQEWMTKHQFEARSYIGGWGPLDGVDLTKQLLLDTDKKTDAIVVASDPIAVGVLRTLQSQNIKVPDDIAVVSFDDIEVSEFLIPSLSTVHIHVEELGRAALRLLDERLNNVRDVPVRLSIDGELIIRESSNKKNA